MKKKEGKRVKKRTRIDHMTEQKRRRNLAWQSVAVFLSKAG